MRPLAALAAAVACSAAVPVIAAGGGGHAPMPLDQILWELGIKILDVAVIAFIGFKVLSKPISKALASRSEAVRRQLEEATAGRREAEARLREFQEKAAGLEAQIDAMNAQAASEIEREQGIILEEGRAAAERVAQHARETIRQEVAKAREELHREAARLAVTLATDTIRAQAGAEDQRRLVSSYLAEMEATR